MSVSTRQTLDHLRRRDAVARADAEARAAVLRERLPEAASLLRALGADRVLLFGSLATGDVHLGSDVDLAVSALPPSRFFEAVGALSRLLGCDVDLVRLEEAPDSLVDRVEAEGVLL